jgi:hypothetical protein
MPTYRRKIVLTCSASSWLGVALSAVFLHADPSECAWAKPPKAEQRGQKSPDNDKIEQEPPLDALAKTKMPCCNCARRSVPWSRAEYYERACDQCLQRNQKFKSKQASQLNASHNGSQNNIWEGITPPDARSRTSAEFIRTHSLGDAIGGGGTHANMMSPPLFAMPQHAATPSQLQLGASAAPNGDSSTGMHVSFADMSLGSSDSHRMTPSGMREPSGLDEPPPRYGYGEKQIDAKAFTHEHMYYEERGRRYALEEQLHFMQNQLKDTSRQRIELERSQVLLELDLEKLRKENEELRRQNSDLVRQAGRTQLPIPGPADGGADI